MRLNGTTVHLPQLTAELAAAGIVVRALGTTGTLLDDPGGNRVITYDDQGEIIDLPPAAAAVIAAHQPQLPPDPPSVEQRLANLETRLGAIERAHKP